MYQQVLDQLLDVGRRLGGLFAAGRQLDQRGQKVSTLFYILQRLLRAQNTPMAFVPSTAENVEHDTKKYC